MRAETAGAGAKGGTLAGVGAALDLGVRIANSPARELTLRGRAPEAAPRTVAVAREESARCTSVWEAVVARRSGWLHDLGAPDLYYLNVGEPDLHDQARLRELLSQGQGAAGIVLDVRGCPRFDHDELVARLLRGPAGLPRFRITRYLGGARVPPIDLELTVYPQEGPSRAGPIAMIVGPETVSAAENLAMMLVGAGRARVIGRQSAGANGNITGLLLPGSFAFRFTGMEVLFPDGGRFAGVGILPERDVEPTQSDLTSGRERALEEAVRVLRGG